MDWTTLTGELKLEELSEQIEQMFPSFSIDFAALLGQILSGNGGEAFRELTASLKNSVLAEAAGMKNLVLTLLIIGVLSALFTVVMQSFENHQIADIAHFISYLLILFVVLRTFTEAADIAGDLLGRILLFVRLFVPTFMLALGLSAGAATAAGYYQLILLLIYGVEQVLKSIGLPAVNIYMMLVVMNGIWEEERLGMFIELLQKGTAGFLKFMLTCITGIGILQSMVTPVLEHLKLNAAGKALSAIPGLGGLAEGTAQMLIGSAVLIKNGLGAAAFLLLIALCLVPFASLLLYAGILKLCAALLGILADKRITDCVNKAGDGLLLLLKIAYTACACFLIMFAIITCLAGRIG